MMKSIWLDWAAMRGVKPLWRQACMMIGFRAMCQTSKGLTAKTVSPFVFFSIYSWTSGRSSSQPPLSVNWRTRMRDDSS